MNRFRYIAISFATILTLSANASTPSLNIVQGAKSSTSRAQHNIVATTEPGNRAFINGKEVKVYSTGGYSENGSPVLIGTYAEETLQKLTADICFISSSFKSQSLIGLVKYFKGLSLIGSTQT